MIGAERARRTFPFDWKSRESAAWRLLRPFQLSQTVMRFGSAPFHLMISAQVILPCPADLDQSYCDVAATSSEALRCSRWRHPVMLSLSPQVPAVFSKQFSQLVGSISWRRDAPNAGRWLMRPAASAVGLNSSLTLHWLYGPGPYVTRPTRRIFVALGNTWARAALTSSIRAREFGMPRVWLPDMEPEASNTIMASSVQGACFFPSVEDAEELQIISAADAMAARRMLMRAANATPRDSELIAQCSREVLATLAKDAASSTLSCPRRRTRTSASCH